MLPDALFNDLPERILLATKNVIKPEESVIVTTTGKLGPTAFLAILKPGSIYLALTDSRLYGFVPTKSGRGISTLAFNVMSSAVATASKRRRKFLVVPVDGHNKTIELSRTFAKQSEQMWMNLNEGR